MTMKQGQSCGDTHTGSPFGAPWGGLTGRHWAERDGYDDEGDDDDDDSTHGDDCSCDDCGVNQMVGLASIGGDDPDAYLNALKTGGLTVLGARVRGGGAL